MLGRMPPRNVTAALPMCPCARAAQRAERPRDPGGVAAFMSAHSETPYITPSMELSSGEGVVRGRRVQQLAFTLRVPMCVWRRFGNFRDDLQMLDEHASSSQA